MIRPNYPLTSRKASPGLTEHARRIKEWMRAAIGEDPETVISVTELACAQPGCPPRQTVVLVLSPGKPGRKASVHKALLEVSEDDVQACVERLDVML